jgi:hypothetical protein
MLALVGEATLTVDNNEANIVKGDNGAATRAVVTNFDPGFALLPGTSHPYNLRLAAGLFAQARF